MPQTLRDLQRRVSAHAGLHPPAWVLAARVRDRVAALRLPDAAAYLRVLEGDAGAAELACLTETLRVGETRFFRHRAHVNALRRVVVPELVRARGAGRGVRAWSAGCATGEEAWTLAMLLAEAAGGGARWSVLATDLSDAALATARAGVYKTEDLAGVPTELRALGLGRGAASEPRRERIAAALATRVRFEHHNLLGPGYPEGFDLILCRNVLIYFEPEARRQVVERLVHSLVPGGYLFLGYAESLRGFAGLEAVDSEDGVIYRRARGPAPRAAAPAVAPARARATRLVPPGAPAAAPQVLAPRAARGDSMLALAGPLDDPAALARALAAALDGAGARLVVDLDGATFLGDALAPVLRRAIAAARTAGVRVELRAARPGPRRWLARHRLDDGHAVGAGGTP